LTHDRVIHGRVEEPAAGDPRVDSFKDIHGLSSPRVPRGLLPRKEHVRCRKHALHENPMMIL
jgi:hypothetical protein